MFKRFIQLCEDAAWLRERFEREDIEREVEKHRWLLEKKNPDNPQLVVTKLSLRRQNLLSNYRLELRERYPWAYRVDRRVQK